MRVKMTNRNTEAWYRKLGKYCFDFVTLKEISTDLTAEQCAEILRHKDFYKNMYGPETKLTIES